MNNDDKSHHEDFYVEPDCCLLCGVPEAIAPEIFGTGEEHCWLKRQPNSKIEIDKTIEVMWSAEVDCVRYSGTDETILKRLGEADLADMADDPSVKRYKPKYRSYVRFSIDGISSSHELAAMFRTDLKKEGLKVMPNLLNPSKVTMSWFRWHFHSVVFGTDGADSFYAELKSIYAVTSLAWRLEGWLSKIGVRQISFLTRAEFRNGLTGTDTPI